MSHERTEFVALPNEILYCIFEFLTPLDILRAFAQLSDRYAELVRFYIKQLDLTDGWQGNQQELQWICQTIQTLKVDRRHIDLLTDHRYPQLHSLELINVFDWENLISNLDLKSLTLTTANPYRIEKSLPETITNLSTNFLLQANSFHTNLINLNVTVHSVVHLLEIVQQIPNVRQLSVTFPQIFQKYYSMRNNQSDRFEELLINFHGLNNLNRLSFRTNDDNDATDNVLLPFKQIEDFIDRCYPILQNVGLKLDHIRFDKDMWSTMMRYKNTFDRFDFYISYIADENASIDIKGMLTNSDLGFHFEGRDSSPQQGHFVHIYSLPFAFDTFHGFTFCSKLSSRTLFSAVRHLYFTPTFLDPIISFESVAKRMPNLISIHCNNLCVPKRNETTVEISIDQDIFKHLNHFHFQSFCMHENCICHRHLLRLLDRMPYLQCLATTLQTLIPELRLRTHDNHFESLDNLAKRVPRLSKLLLGDLLYVDQLSQIISSLFIQLPILRSISFDVYQQCSQDETPYEEILQDALSFTQKIDDRLRHLKLNYESEEAIFYLEETG